MENSAFHLRPLLEAKRNKLLFFFLQSQLPIYLFFLLYDISTSLILTHLSQMTSVVAYSTSEFFEGHH